jgi:hypothetical protein
LNKIIAISFSNKDLNECNDSNINDKDNIAKTILSIISEIVFQNNSKKESNKIQYCKKGIGDKESKIGFPGSRVIKFGGIFDYVSAIVERNPTVHQIDQENKHIHTIRPYAVVSCTSLYHIPQ